MTGWIESALPLIASGVTAAIAAIATGLTRRGANRADAAAKVVETGLKLVQELQEELERMRGRVSELELEVTDCENRYRSLSDDVARLRYLVAHHGIDPTRRPDNMEPGL